MQKDTIEIERRKNHIFGYTPLYSFGPDSAEILDYLIKWSKDKSEKIYKHKVRYEEENISNSEFYKVRDDYCPPKDIPYCDLVCYLDIYYQ